VTPSAPHESKPECANVTFECQLDADVHPLQQCTRQPSCDWAQSHAVDVDRDVAMHDACIGTFPSRRAASRACGRIAARNSSAPCENTTPKPNVHRRRSAHLRERGRQGDGPWREARTASGWTGADDADAHGKQGQTRLVVEQCTPRRIPREKSSPTCFLPSSQAFPRSLGSIHLERTGWRLSKDACFLPRFARGEAPACERSTIEVLRSDGKRPGKNSHSSPAAKV